jgi:hypothetical protein
MAVDAFVPSEKLLDLKAAYLRHSRAGSAVPLLALSAATLFLTGLLGVVGFAEFNLFLEIFTLIKGPAVPGEDAAFNVHLLAMTGLLVMLGFHIHAHENADAFAVVLIRRAVAALLPVYALGAGLAVASVIYFGGADALVAQTADMSGDLFAATEAPDSGPGLERVIAMFPVIFAVGCGGLAVINLFISDRLVTLILGNAKKTVMRWRCAREARAAMAVIRAAQARHVELCQQRDGLAAEQATFELGAVHEILTAISDAVAPYETHLTHAAMASGGENNPFAVPLSNLDRKTMAARVAALRGVSFKTVLAALRGAKE